MRTHSVDDHPQGAPHIECLTDHKGEAVPRHCRCGGKWPCQFDEEAQ